MLKEDALETTPYGQTEEQLRELERVRGGRPMVEFLLPGQLHPPSELQAAGKLSLHALHLSQLRHCLHVQIQSFPFLAIAASIGLYCFYMLYTKSGQTEPSVYSRLDVLLAI